MHTHYRESEHEEQSSVTVAACSKALRDRSIVYKTSRRQIWHTPANALGTEEKNSQVAISIDVGCSASAVMPGGCGRNRAVSWTACAIAVFRSGWTTETSLHPLSLPIKTFVSHQRPPHRPLRRCSASRCQMDRQQTATSTSSCFHARSASLKHLAHGKDLQVLKVRRCI